MARSDPRRAPSKPSSALTRWLKQGLARQMCPLCRVAHKLDREYIWYFFDEYSTQDAALTELRRARGFCADHAEQLRRVEVDGLKSTLGISTTYLDTLEGLAADLAALTTERDFERDRCPACVYRDEGVAQNVGYLLDELATDERSRVRFEASPGLCVGHFQQVWRAARTPEERELVLAVQRRSIDAIVTDLREHIRKQGAEFKHEPKGPEQDSWERAVAITGGWPAPPGSAGEPED